MDGNHVLVFETVFSSCIARWTWLLKLAVRGFGFQRAKTKESVEAVRCFSVRMHTMDCAGLWKGIWCSTTNTIGVLIETFNRLDSGDDLPYPPDTTAISNKSPWDRYMFIEKVGRNSATASSTFPRDWPNHCTAAQSRPGPHKVRSTSHRYPEFGRKVWYHRDFLIRLLSSHAEGKELKCIATRGIAWASVRLGPMVRMDVQGAFDTLFKNHLLQRKTKQGWSPATVRFVCSSLSDYRVPVRLY